MLWGEIPVDGVDEEDDGDVAIEGVDDGAEGFLAGGVPDLEFDGEGGGEVDGFGAVFDAQGGRVGGEVLVGGEAVEQGGFAHAGGADGDEFQRVFGGHWELL